MAEDGALSKFFEHQDQLIRTLSQAVEQSASTVLITDLDGTIIYVNRRFTQLTGYSQREVLGKNPRILQSGKTPPEIYSEMWQSLTQGKEWRGELQNKKKNGELYWESLTVSPIRNEHGVVTHFLGIEEDITKRKLLELELERTLNELKRANTELDRFTSVVAHDLRGPLHNIMSVLGLALRKSGDEMSAEAKGMISLALASTRKAGEFLKDLLQYASAKAHENPLTEVNMNEVLTSVLEECRFEISEAQGQITVEELPIVLGNKLLISQLCQNLIANAIKYRKGTPLDLRITAKDDGDLWLFSFSDNGIGMAPEEISKIFEPFYRIASSSALPGSGIGLATCQKIVNAHGGRIWAKSEKGKGSEFLFTLPKAH